MHDNIAAPSGKTNILHVPSLPKVLITVSDRRNRKVRTFLPGGQGIQSVVSGLKEFIFCLER